MQLRWISSIAAGLLVATSAARAQQAPKGGEEIPAASNGPLKTLKQRSSYAIGLDIGQNLKTQGIDIDPDVFAKGVTDALGGGKSLMTKEEIAATMLELQKTVGAKQKDRFVNESKKNKTEGDTFLAENTKKAGVKTLPSGLQYRVVKEGAGATPKLTDTVTTHYRGALLDGTVFDSSYDRKQPASFPVNKVIKGWTEALQLMKVGDKWQLFIPSDLAYGEHGAGEDIPPNATLVFDIELLDIKKGAAAGPESVNPE